jgi:pimeloyl-ACP methyl ester carboxylesterase
MRELDLVPHHRGLRLRVCTWGEGGDRPLLFLHGFLEQGAAWDAVATQLPRRSFAPDHRGHGCSEHVGTGGFYHFWNYVSDTDGLIDQLGGEVDLVGHSMGGTLASLIAATRPEKVRRLVLIEGLGPPDVRQLAVERSRDYLDRRVQMPPKHPSFANLDEAIARMRAVNPGLPHPIARRLAERNTREVLPDDPEVREPVVPGRLTWRWDPYHRLRTPNPFDRDLFLAYLRQIRAPTLLIDGGRSLFRLPPSDIAERREAVANHRHMVIPDAGHMIHHDTPDQLAEAIATHLGED